MDKSAKYYAYAEELYILVEPNLKQFSESQINNYIKFLERYTFKTRKENQEPHPNTKKDHLKRKKSDNKTPKGLARATLRSLDPHYNALTANNKKNALIEIIKINLKDTFLNLK